MCTSMSVKAYCSSLCHRLKLRTQPLRLAMTWGILVKVDCEQVQKVDFPNPSAHLLRLNECK